MKTATTINRFYHRRVKITITSLIALHTVMLLCIQTVDPVITILEYLEHLKEDPLIHIRQNVLPFLSPSPPSSPLTSPLTSPLFADTFPERNLVLDMMQLCADVFKVGGGITPQDAISNPKFQFELWIHASFSTTGMIVSAAHDTGARNKTTITPIIVFRGSDSIQDWIVDLDVEMETSKFPNAPSDVMCHKGFQDALFDQDVISNIEGKIVELIGEEGNVIFTGHSLGAANAHITATYMADVYPKMNITTINFGSPRLGNLAFKTWTEGTLPNLAIWRFVNKQDIVPRVVSRKWGYIHAGHLHMLNRDNGRVYYRQVGDGAKLLKGAPMSWYRKFMFDMISVFHFFVFPEHIFLLIIPLFAQLALLLR